MKAYEKLTEDDLKEFQESFGTHLTLEDMEAIINAENPSRSLLHRGRMWGWSDTEVRDDVYVTVKNLPQYDEKEWS